MSRRVVVVDDSNMMRNRIVRVCTGGRLPGWQVVAEARNGREAVTACAAARPEVVTMDLTMPEMDGVACIEQLVAAHPEVLILVVSALSDKATAIRALTKGAHGFLYKPFTDEQLVAALRELTE